MTGHGRGAAQSGGIRVEVEISSVNRKQLDLSCVLPRALAFLESRVQEVASAALVRGRVTIDVAVKRARDSHGAVRVDEALAAEYLGALRALSRKLKLPADAVTLRDIVAQPGVLRVEAPEEDVELVWPALRAALEQALKGHTAMREREGKKLAADLTRRAARLGKLLGLIRRAAPGVAGRYRVALLSRVRAALQELPVPEERIEREIVLFADRSDVSEELTRLDSHLDQVGVMLRGRDPAGRSLDFLAQELLREINTIGSKANDAEIAGRVVEFKAELERFREQVQNIE